MDEVSQQGIGSATFETTAVPPSGIAAIRRSLGFGEKEEALVRKAKERLSNEIDGWVDRFYLRSFNIGGQIEMKCFLSKKEPAGPGIQSITSRR